MPPTTQQLIGHFRPKIAKDLLRRGLKVQGRARLLLSGASRHPKRVDTGNLRSSISVQLRSVRGNPAVRIGTNVKYSRFVHDGTGIYGPRRRPIKPKRAKYLVFKSSTTRKTVFAKSVKGMPRNQFLKDALPAARD